MLAEAFGGHVFVAGSWAVCAGCCLKQCLQQKLGKRLSALQEEEAWMCPSTSSALLPGPPYKEAFHVGSLV